MKKFYIIIFIVTLLIGCSNQKNETRDYKRTRDLPGKISDYIMYQSAGVINIQKSNVGEQSDLVPTAVEIVEGVDFQMVNTFAFEQNGLWWTCGELTLINNSEQTLTNLILIATAPVFGDQIAVRTGNSGTGYDGSGTGYRTTPDSNGGWALWLVKESTGNVILPGEPSDPRILCLASPTGYSSSVWTLYSQTPGGRLIDRDTGNGVSGWVMLGYSNPDNIRYPELGRGNFIFTDSDGNFMFPEVNYSGPHTITAGAGNYSYLTVAGINNYNITLKLKNNNKSFVAVGNYNGTLGNAGSPNPPINYSSSCTGCFTGTACGDNVITAGIFPKPAGYYDIVTQFNTGFEELYRRTVQINYNLIYNPFGGSACSFSYNLESSPIDYCSESVIPSQSEVFPSSPVMGISIVKGEAWTVVPRNQSSVKLIGGIYSFPFNAIISLNPQKISSTDILNLINQANFKGGGYSANFSTSINNVPNLQLGFYKNVTNTLSITLGNLPASDPPREVISEILVDVTTNSRDVRLFPQWFKLINTSQSGVLMNYVSGEYLGGNILSLVYVSDEYRRVNTYLQNAKLLHLYRATGIQYTIPNYTIDTFFDLVPFVWSGGEGVNDVSRRVKITSGENSNSPVADALVVLITKKDTAPPIVEESPSCSGTNCCANKDSQGRCIYYVEYNKILWEIISKGDRTEVNLPDLPESVDIKVNTESNYPDLRFPEIYAGQIGWCPGDVLCNTNKSSYDFSLDTDPDPEILANNATHLTWNSFGIGAPVVINPANEAQFANGSQVTVNGFLAGGGWDLVPCNAVRILATDSSNNIILDSISSLVPAGGCGIGLPPYCFSSSFNCPADTKVNITITPLGSSNTQCGNTAHWEVKCGAG